MKLLVDLLPVILFFAVYKLSDIYTATATAMVVAVVQTVWFWLRQRRLQPMQVIVPVLIVGLGALTLVLDDPAFITWKPTLVNWAFAAVFIGGELIGRKGVLERMIGQQFTLPPTVWRRLGLAWIGFFIGIGALNLFVAYRYDLDTWVDFKLYGMLGLTLLFALLQGVYLSRHLPAEVAADKES